MKGTAKAMEKKPTNPEDARRMKRVFPELNKQDIPSDVLGSYTGITEKGERPVQDADDL
ncbi:MAG: hypothetical protein ACLVML_08090 [Candidatus Gastranaerophilaceae bacterium]|jgi:hypothetical protein|nr:hypothetical protein [Christensenellales bacterium]